MDVVTLSDMCGAMAVVSLIAWCVWLAADYYL